MYVMTLKNTVSTKLTGVSTEWMTTIRLDCNSSWRQEGVQGEKEKKNETMVELVLQRL